MTINVCFDLHASIIECDNLENIEFSEILSKFDNWLYEIGTDGIAPCKVVKKSLSIEILDISVVIRFFNEIYPNSNPRVINSKIDLDDMDENNPVIPL